MAIKRVYVHAAIYEKFRNAVVEYATNFKVGPGTQQDAYVGPLQNSVQYDKVLSYFDDISKDGQQVALGGSKDNTVGKGYFITPTIIDNPPDSARIVQEEPFGPIVPFLKWDGSDEEVVARANDSKHGLGASVWSRDLKRAEKMARSLEAGMYPFTFCFSPLQLSMLTTLSR